jgi:hypothetical protein
VFEQALVKMRQVAVGIAGGRDAFIHLKNLDVFPGHRFLRKIAEHHPGRPSTAHGERELTTLGHGFPGRGGDPLGGSVGDGVRIGKDFELHGDKLWARVASSN